MLSALSPSDWIEIWKIAGGIIVACITTGGAIFGFIWNARKKDMQKLTEDGTKRKEELKEHITDQFLAIIRAGMLSAADEAGPDSTHVVRLRFASGFSLSVPLVSKPVPVGRSGATIMLRHSDAHRTRYELYCPGSYQIQTHSHPEEEQVFVVYGLMEDLTTGRVYHPGETWTIPANEDHNVLFYSGTLVCIEVRPPLPTLRNEPLDLAHLRQLDENQ